MIALNLDFSIVTPIQDPRSKIDLNRHGQKQSLSWWSSSGRVTSSSTHLTAYEELNGPIDPESIRLLPFGLKVCALNDYRIYAIYPLNSVYAIYPIYPIYLIYHVSIYTPSTLPLHPVNTLIYPYKPLFSPIHPYIPMAQIELWRTESINTKMNTMTKRANKTNCITTTKRHIHTSKQYSQRTSMNPNDTESNTGVCLE